MLSRLCVSCLAWLMASLNVAAQDAPAPPAEAPMADAAKAEAPRTDTSKADASSSEAQKADVGAESTGPKQADVVDGKPAEKVAATEKVSEKPASNEQKPHANPDSRGRNTAVALNYCRASFHRIRRYQSKRVLVEEQEKILNNLNLNGIGDEEVIKLYSSVLDEISRAQIADREIAVLQEKFRKGVYRQMSAAVLQMGTQAALASFEGAVRTGVNSWLDYRDLSWSRELDVWKVDKERMQVVVEKSTSFLDTFWKLAQKKNIPDRWLVRGDDLDALEDAVREADPEKRLRILRRMEPFMECYPPYWYFVARAIQAHGHFEESAQTYDRVAELGFGHFRKDDMLAASLANRAIIQEYLKHADAERSAKEALAHSSAVWEANLMCAYVLERHGQIKEAEDAILRNLDVDLEKPCSSAALVGLYCRHDRSQQLQRALAADEFVTVLPVTSLFKALQKIGPEKTPSFVINRLKESLSVSIDSHFGPDDVLLTCDPLWQAHQSKLRLVTLSPTVGAQTFELPPTAPSATGELQAKFRGAVEIASVLGTPSTELHGAMLSLQSLAVPPDTAPVLVVLGAAVPRKGTKQGTRPVAASPAEIRWGDWRLRLQNDVPVAVTELSLERKPDSASAVDRRPRARIVDITPLPQR